MKCFNHHERDAFGICKTCGKGLCLDCIEIHEGSVVYKDSKECKEFATVSNIGIKNVKNIYYSKDIKRDTCVGIWVLLLLGIALFVAFFMTFNYIYLIFSLVLLMLGVAAHRDYKNTKFIEK